VGVREQYEIRKVEAVCRMPSFWSYNRCWTCFNTGI